MLVGAEHEETVEGVGLEAGHDNGRLGCVHLIVQFVIGHLRRHPIDLHVVHHVLVDGAFRRRLPLERHAGVADGRGVQLNYWAR